MKMIGTPVEFEFSSADASTAAVIVLREAGARASRSLAANERLIVQGLTAVIAAGATPVKMIADTDGDGDVDAGDLMAVLHTGYNDFTIGGTGQGIAGTKAVMPKIKAAGAGQIDISGVGVIVLG